MVQNNRIQTLGEGFRDLAQLYGVKVESLQRVRLGRWPKAREKTPIAIPLTSKQNGRVKEIIAASFNAFKIAGLPAPGISIKRNGNGREILVVHNLREKGLDAIFASKFTRRNGETPAPPTL